MLALGYLLKVRCRSRSVDDVVCVAAYKPLFMSKVADILLKNFLDQSEEPGLIMTSRARTVVMRYAISNKPIAA